MRQCGGARYGSPRSCASPPTRGHLLVIPKAPSRNLLDVRIANDLTYRFAPWHDSAARLIAEIADHHYEAREVAARAGNESVAERFADAFRIRKGDG